MSKIPTVIAGVFCGVIGVGIMNSEESGKIYDKVRDGDTPTQLDVSAPNTEVRGLTAIAVGMISGTVTVNGEYDLVRWGPVPNCDINISMTLPFIAEPIVQLKDLDIVQGKPDAAGFYNVDVKVNGDVEVLNPRSILSEPIVEHSGNGFGSSCDPENYDNLMNNMFDVGGKATATAAQCLASAVTTDYVTDTNGNRIRESDQSLAIHEIFEDDLKIAMEALYPNGRVSVDWPDPEPGFDVTQTPTFLALQKAVAETQDDKYTLNTQAVDSCVFESLTLDVALPPVGV